MANIRIFTGYRNVTYKNQKIKGIIDYQCCKCGYVNQTDYNIKQSSSGTYHVFQNKDAQNSVKQSVLTSLIKAVRAWDECIGESMNVLNDYDAIYEVVKCDQCGYIQPWSKGAKRWRKEIPNIMYKPVYHSAFNIVPEYDIEGFQSTVSEKSMRDLKKMYIFKHIGDYILFVIVLLMVGMFLSIYLHMLLPITIGVCIIIPFAWCIIVKININKALKINDLTVDMMNQDLQNASIISKDKIWIGNRYLYTFDKPRIKIIDLYNIIEVYVVGVRFDTLLLKNRDGQHTQIKVGYTMIATDAKRAIRLKIQNYK